MAERCLLHLNKLDLFTWWLASIGYEIQPTKGDSEALRAKKEKSTVIVYKKLGAKEHLIVQQKDRNLVMRFIRQQNEIKCKRRKSNNEMG